MAIDHSACASTSRPTSAGEVKSSLEHWKASKWPVRRVHCMANCNQCKIFVFKTCFGCLFDMAHSFASPPHSTRNSSWGVHMLIAWKSCIQLLQIYHEWRWKRQMLWRSNRCLALRQHGIDWGESKHWMPMIHNMLEANAPGFLTLICLQWKHARRVWSSVCPKTKEGGG